jgi:DNA replication protein DnaC
MFLRSYECEHCQDFGISHVIGVRKDGTEVDLGIQPCKHCQKGQDEAARRLKIKFADLAMDESYQHYSFASFDALPREYREGKQMARAAAQVFVQRKGKPFGKADIYTARKMGYAGTDKPRMGIVYYGGYGVGKTGLAATIANELTFLGERVLFATVYKLMKKVQDGYGDDALRGYLYEVQQMPFLILDECAFENVTKDRKDILAAIIDYRNSNYLPYVITVNLDPPKFEETWGTYTAARVNANCHWIKVGGMVLRDEAQPISD